MRINDVINMKALNKLQVLSVTIFVENSIVLEEDYFDNSVHNELR